VSGTNPIQELGTGFGTLASGTWVIKCLGDSSDVSNVTITDPDGVVTTYTVNSNDVFNGTIPGVKFTFIANNIQPGTTVNVILAKAIVDRYTLKFDEDVSTAGAAGTYTITGSDAAITAANRSYYESNDTNYWYSCCADLDIGDTVTFTVYGISDLAGNPGGTAASPLTKSCNASVPSATALKP